MSYKTQGFIKEINLADGTFTIEPTSPYSFDKTEANGTQKKYAVFVDGDVGVASVSAFVAQEGVQFKVNTSMCSVDTLISMRHAHDKLEIEIDADADTKPSAEASLGGGASAGKDKKGKMVASIKIVK